MAREDSGSTSAGTCASAAHVRVAPPGWNHPPDRTWSAPAEHRLGRSDTWTPQGREGTEVARQHQPHRTVAERREQLLDATVAVIREGGLPAVTTRSVTAHAGVRPSALYYYFADRDELVGALIERELTRTLSHVWEAVEQAAGVREGVEVALLAYLAHVQRDESYQLVAAELTVTALRRAGPAGVRSPYEQLLGAATRLVRRWSEVRGSSWALPVESVARALVSQGSAVVASWLLTRDDAGVRAEIRAMALAMSSLETPPGTPPTA